MKSHLSIFVPCLFFYIGILSDGVSGVVDDDAPKRIVCYFKSWTFRDKHPYNYDTKDIPLNLCTDVVYAFLTFDSETFELDNPRNTDMLRMRQFTSLKGSEPGPNLFLGIGGGGDDGRKWSTMIADSSKRLSFVTSVLRRMREYGFDGLDLDWMRPRPADRDNFVKLIEDLVDAFRRPGYLLSSTVDLIEVVEKYNNGVSGYDIQRLSELFNWINVMDHTLRGPWNDFVDVPTPLYRRPFDDGKFKNLNVHDGFEILVSLGAPRHKLVMGVPFFGRSYTLRSSSETFISAPANASLKGGDPGPITNSRGFMTFFEICRKVSSGKWTRRFDHVGKCPYAFNGDQWVGYEDEQSLRIKMDFIKNLGYGGAYIWAINMDDFNGFCGSKNPLLSTMHNALVKRDEENVDREALMLKKRYEAMGIIPISTM